MEKVYVCGNPECQFSGRQRRVGLVYLGQHLYLDAPVVCACGQVATCP